MGHPVNGSSHHEPDQGLVGIGVKEARIVGSGIPQHQALAVAVPFRIEDILIAGGRRGGLERAVNTITQNVKITTGTKGRRARGRPTERFGQKNKIPFPRPHLVDDVFPTLRRQSVGEVRTDPVNANGGLTGRRAVCATGLLKPIQEAVGIVFPYVLGYLVETPRAGAVIKPVPRGQLIIVILGI